MRPPDSAKRNVLGEWVHKANADMDVAEHLPSGS